MVEMVTHADGPDKNGGGAAEKGVYLQFDLSKLFCMENVVDYAATPAQEAEWDCSEWYAVVDELGCVLEGNVHRNWMRTHWQIYADKILDGEDGHQYAEFAFGVVEIAGS
jgi:hypothetical protein